MNPWPFISAVFWFFFALTLVLAIASLKPSWFIAPILCVGAAAYCNQQSWLAHRYPHTYPDEEFE